MTVLVEDLKMIFNLQYGNVISTECSRQFLIFKKFFPRNEKSQTNSLSGTVQINWRLLNILSKYAFTLQLTKILGYPLLLKKFVLILKFHYAKFYRKNKS